VTADGSPLRFQAARAALSSGTSQAITRVLAVVLSIVTARALEPRDVGILGLAVIGMGVISMIGFYPETAAVTASGHAGDARYALAASFIRALIIAALLVLLALVFPLLAHRLTDGEGGAEQMRQLLVVLALLPVLELIGGYPQIILQRKLDLNYVAWIQLLQPVVFVGLAIVLLYEGQGYIGVARANVAGAAIATGFMWFRIWWRGWRTWEGLPSRADWRETTSGTARMFLGGFGGYLGERADNLLVAGAIGPTAMSFYSMAWNASRTPANVFARAINFVLVPTLARIQDEPDRVQKALRECLRHSYILLAPICAVLFVSAPLLVTYILGPKWLPLVACLRIMCFTVLAIPVLFASNALLVGLGRAHLIGIATVIHIIVLIVIIPPLSNRWGIVGAACGDLIAVAILTFTLCFTARIATQQVKWGLISSLVVPVVAAFCAGLLAWSTARYLPNDLTRLVAEAGLVLVGYFIFVILFGGKNRLFDLTTLLRGVFRRPTVAAQSHT
jgi:O-antigen/teichoic acid export membrane protein